MHTIHYNAERIRGYQQNISRYYISIRLLTCIFNSYPHIDIYFWAALLGLPLKDR